VNAADQCPAAVGTLRHITPDLVVRASGLVKSGEVVSLGRVVDHAVNDVSPGSVELQVTLEGDPPFAFGDQLSIRCHGFALTHLDALGHVYRDGRVYGGSAAADLLGAHGLRHGDALELSGGIVTRGVLLDLTQVRQRPWLTPDDVITPADLEAAERLARLTVGAGDAVMAYVGREAYERSAGWSPAAAQMCGLSSSAIPWLAERRVAVWAGECVEKLPSDDPELAMPLHMRGLPDLGLVIVDNPSLEGLAARCRAYGRSEFLYICAGLRLRGATGCLVNPLAVF
jgi:kynurenine formamidase